MTVPIDRRRMLAGALGLATLALETPGRLGRLRALFAEEEAAGPNTLVLLQLSGGNDGLSTVIPFADDAYGRARRTLRFEREEVLAIDDRLGLHPELRHLRRELDEGRLAIVQGAGYPNPNRSHFKSMDIWHSASPDGRAAMSGWIGRLSERVFADGSNPERVVHVGEHPPWSLHSATHPAVAFVEAARYRWLANERELSELASRPSAPSGSPALDLLRGTMRDAAASSERVRAAMRGYEARADYPRGALADSLRAAAALIRSDLGCRVVSVEHTGYDTHQGQRPAHDRLMAELDGALGAFRADLAGAEAGHRTVVVTFSEFGRRIVENASGGTDHGTAAPMFVLGESVRGGLIGEHPSLTERDGEDLVFTTDFRSVYAALIEELFDVDPADVLGASYPRLPLFA
jgi:uncharacterized protein (DUF1501 family)